MSLRNRIHQFFNKSKSSPETAAQEAPEQSADPNAVTWDSLAAKHQDDEPKITWDSLAAERQDNTNPQDTYNANPQGANNAEPEITFDNLARLVRFPGSALTNSEIATADSLTPEATVPGNPQEGALAPAVPSPEETLSTKAATADALATETLSTKAATADALATETQESAPISPELRAFKNFFKTDMRIKRELLDAAPKPTDDYDAVSRMGYVEDAYHTFRDFKHDFLGIARDFNFGESVAKSTEDFFRRGQENFALADYGSGATQDLYRKAFTDMRPQFVEEVKDGFSGYNFFGRDLSSVINDASTVNELLHAYHSYIMNSDHILRRIPALAEKPAKNGEPITLRGDHSVLGQQVFDSFPDDFDVGFTDIVSADDHIMMMVRNRGHALTISSEPDTEDPSKIWVNYNIPKLCNEEMIKALPGLAGYTKNGARGGFVVPRDQLGSSLVDFIAKVPTDDDIPPRIYD